MKTKKKFIVLLSILLIGAFLRFWQISNFDSYTDEALLAFRSIGLIDYVASPTQTTPWQWVQSVPWWMHLSFHDHPLVFFLLQHASFQLFGETLFAVRLPTVLAGIGVILMTYFMAREFFGEKPALAAAALVTVSSYHVWLSKLGLQDGVILACSLLAFYLYLKALKVPQYWLAVGPLCGIGLLTKYTFVITFAVMCLHAIMYRSLWRSTRYLWWGVGLFFLIITPIWLYNMHMYRTFGHFDFQISAFFGQDVPRWAFRYGRELTGGLADRIINFFRVLKNANSPFFNGAILVGCIISVIRIARGTLQKGQHFFFFCIALFFFWFLIIGSTYRFISIIIPFVSIFVASLACNKNQSLNVTRVSTITMTCFLLFELAFSVNTYFVAAPIGYAPWTHAVIGSETKNLGFNQLNTYLDEVTKGRMSALFGQPDYQFLTDIVKKRQDIHRAQGDKPLSIMIIYDSDINQIARLWTFSRRIVYDGWLTIGDDDFTSVTSGQFDAYYRPQGVESFLYVHRLKEDVRQAGYISMADDSRLFDYVTGKKLVPTYVKNNQGENVFAMYTF